MPVDDAPLGEVAGPLTDRVDYSLYVVTSIDVAGERSGCLAGFVTQCSIKPTRFIVCISSVNHTFDVVRKAHAVGLHLLGADQSDLASLFGEATGDAVEKFACSAWKPGETGVPILADCAAWIEGRIDDRFEAGDHQALLVTPVAGGAGTPPGSLTFQTAPRFEPGHPADDQ